MRKTFVNVVFGKMFELAAKPTNPYISLLQHNQTLHLTRVLSFFFNLKFLPTRYWLLSFSVYFFISQIYRGSLLARERDRKSLYMHHASNIILFCSIEINGEKIMLSECKQLADVYASLSGPTPVKAVNHFLEINDMVCVIPYFVEICHGGKIGFLLWFVQTQIMY